MALKEGEVVTPQPNDWVEDGGHYLPDHEWETVKQHAALVKFYDPDTDDDGIFLDVERVSSVSVLSRAVAPVVNIPNTTKHNGMSGMTTQFFVQHDAECPLEGGFAVSLTNWADQPLPKGPVASWHSFCDPIARVRMVPWYYAAWVQGYANPFSIGMEVAGYAKFSWAEWRTPAGLQQIENTAHEWVYYWNIEKANGNIIPLRWLETWEVNAVMAGNRSIKGFCTHGQIEPGSRWDPGPNFPYKELMDRIKELVYPVKKKEWWEMAVPDEDVQRIADAVAARVKVPTATAVASAVGTRRVQLHGIHASKGTTNEDTTTGWQAHNLTTIQNQNKLLLVKVAELTALQAADKDITEERLSELLEQAARKVLAELEEKEATE